MSRFRELLNRKQVILFDGAMGTELLKRGFPDSKPIEYANISSRDLVASIHRDYIEAGADCIETNTFGANEYKLGPFGYSDLVERINREGVRIAKEVGGNNVCIIGSIGPIGKPIGDGFEINERLATEIYKRQIVSLIEEEVDAILLETMSSTKEVQILLKIIKSLTDIPIIVQFSLTKDFTTILGEGIDTVIRFLKDIEVDIVGLNCGNGPLYTLESLKIFSENLNGPFSVQPNAGYPQVVQDRIIYNTEKEYFSSFTEEYIKYGAKIIGGCCGTTPQHISLVKKRLNKNIESPIRVREESIIESLNLLERDEPSSFSKKLKTSFIVSVEITPPKGIELRELKDKVIELKKLGIDTINITDSPMARVRISPIALAHILKEELGIESILHFTCRDRNLISLQSELLGASALGIKNILALTGDPPSIGDHPQAKPVFDVNSEGLVRIINRLNSGVDYMGNPLNKATSFTIGVALNPNAEDISQELEKLKRKIDIGIDFIETQPIYERKAIERILEKIDYKLPPVIGSIIPLKNSRQVEFLHNEVPGIFIPRWIREKIKESKDPIKDGLEIILKIIEEIRDLVSGICIIPPISGYNLINEIVKYIKSKDIRRKL